MKEGDSKDRILELLAERDMTVTELSKVLGISKATVSHHIDNLSKMGYIGVSKEERVKNFIKRFYSLKIPNGNVGQVIVDSMKDCVDKKETCEYFRNVVRLLGYVMLKVSPYLFKKAGYEVGVAINTEGEGIDGLAEIWEKLGMGKTSFSKDSFVVEECYFCSGLPNTGVTYCKFDEGFIAGYISAIEKVKVEEVKCWGNGYEFCEFKIKRIN